nr:uncharacterized protein LOC112015202 [Quercus suber]
MTLNYCRVTIGTWNVAGRLPCEDLEIDDWLCTEEPADIYILGCSKTLYWTKNEFSQLKRKFETVVQILLEARTIYPNLSKLGLALEKSFQSTTTLSSQPSSTPRPLSKTLKALSTSLNAPKPTSNSTASLKFLKMRLRIAYKTLFRKSFPYLVIKNTRPLIFFWQRLTYMSFLLLSIAREERLSLLSVKSFEGDEYDESHKRKAIEALKRMESWNLFNDTYEEFQNYTVARDAFLTHLGSTLWGSMRHIISPSIADGAFHHFEKISFQLYFITQEKVRNIELFPVDLKAINDGLSSMLLDNTHKTTIQVIYICQTEPKLEPTVTPEANTAYTVFTLINFMVVPSSPTLSCAYRNAGASSSMPPKSKCRGRSSIAALQVESQSRASRSGNLLRCHCQPL